MSNTFATPWTVSHELLYPWDFPVKNTGVGCHFLLQAIFLTQESSPRLLHWAGRFFTTVSPREASKLLVEIQKYPILNKVKGKNIWYSLQKLPKMQKDRNLQDIIRNREKANKEP